MKQLCFFTDYPNSEEILEIEVVEEYQDEEPVTCKFPELDPYDPSIIPLLEEHSNINCTEDYPLIFKTDFGNKLIQIAHPFPPMQQEVGGQEPRYNYSCCYKTVERKNDTDRNATLSEECHPLHQNETVIPPSHEFIYVNCEDFDNTNDNNSTSKYYFDMFSFVPIKPFVEERIKTYKEAQAGTIEESSMEKLSVLILGIDGQSRMNFIRELPKSYEYLTKELSAIELKGYVKVGDNTLPNTAPMLCGLSELEFQETCYPSKDSYFDDCPFIWTDFAQNGYRTSMAEDSVWVGAFHYLKKGFLRPPTDYYFHPMSLLMDEKMGHWLSFLSRMCFGPRLSFEILLDYAIKTAEAFKNFAYFQFIWSNSIFHDFASLPRVGDEILKEALEYLETAGLLNNTALFLMSDHGIRWGKIRAFSYQGSLEERMPLGFIRLPPWFREKYPEAQRNLEGNALKLTTTFDFHETLQDLLSLGQGREVEFNEIWSSRNKNGTGNDDEEAVPRGISLFRPIPSNRTCKMAGIDDHWCVCHPAEVISNSSAVVLSAANFVVGWINEKLANYGQYPCAKLELLQVNQTRRTIIPNEGEDVDADADDNIIELQFHLVTTPGNGLFEVTVVNEDSNGDRDRKWRLGGDISRITTYANSSVCTNDFKIQKYCHCLD